MEDKLVQRAVVTVLSQIYEEDFIGFSYGFRPGRSQHDALDALATGITQFPIRWILDADMQRFFDTIPHEQLIRLLKIRIGDKRILRLIQKWLKTGYMEEDKIYRQTIGTPQGSVISPFLANVYLHYVLDLWVLKERQCSRYGRVIIVRYADDFILGFQYKSTALNFLDRIRERLKAFGLLLHPEKTRLLEFGRYATINRRRRGEGKPETFDFLGFTHISGKTKTGFFMVRRITSRKTMRKTLTEVKEKLRNRMHRPVQENGQWLGSVVRGFGQYFGVPGNSANLERFRQTIARIWLQSLRRRSQKGKRLTWKRFTQIMDKYVPHLRICHPFPEVRFKRQHSR